LSNTKTRLRAGFFVSEADKKDGLCARLKVPADAQGECGEDQKAGTFQTFKRQQGFP
jgi:hypothetical protein